MGAFDEWVRAKFSEIERERADMHGYQNDLYWHFRYNPFSAGFVDMGLGKTVTMATVISDLLDEQLNSDNPELPVGSKVLIIGPKRVAYETWPTEFRIWRHLAHHNVSVIKVEDDDPRLRETLLRKRAEAREMMMFGAEAEKYAQDWVKARKEQLRKDAATSNASIHIVSFDWLPWLVEFYDRKWPYRMVVIDESSGFKDWQSKRFKCLAAIRQAKGYITRLHELTATPAAESYLGLWSQIYLMDAGKRFSRHITHFKEDYFKENRYTRKWDLVKGCEEKIIDKIKDICMILKAKDHLNLEDPVIVQRKAHMSERAAAIYKKMQEDAFVKLDDDSEIEAKNAASVCAKLQQIASGVLYDMQLKPGMNELDPDACTKVLKVHHIHDEKIEMLKEIVEEAQGSPILVGYHFKSSLDRLKKAFPKAVVMDDDGKCVKPWNAGKIPMLLMHPQSGGHGLNLQKGPGHHIVFFDIPWSLELFLQFIGRLARQGQKNKVVVQLLTMIGTVDEGVFAALSRKEEGQEGMFRLLKKLRADWLKFRKKILTIEEVDEVM